MEKLDHMVKSVWITWENQVRNRSMAKMLGAKLHVFAYGGKSVKRYLICIYKTISALISEKPKIVYAQNPSIVLNYVLIFARFIFRYTLVSDAHFGGVIACNGSKLFQKALDLCNYFVDLVIVTNKDHVNYIEALGGKAVICEDPLPDLEQYRTDDENDMHILYICSFDVDEPYEEAFKAADLLKEEGFVMDVSGNYLKVNIAPGNYSSVNFLGYLPENAYYNKLFLSSVILDLTEYENCLVCGAYEAMSAEKPLVTSDTLSLKSYFTHGTIFTGHDAKSIADAIKSAYENRINLKDQIRVWKTAVDITQKKRISHIYNALGINVMP
jgi:glycosyltransferase involved in cell wall biosynthesis